MKENVFSLFPQLGYPVNSTNIPTTNGHKYRCATSGAWQRETAFTLKCQIIDKYLGMLSIELAFKDSEVTVTMKKTAEAIKNTLKAKETTNLIPATLLKAHPDFLLYIDEDSAKGILNI